MPTKCQPDNKDLTFHITWKLSFHLIPKDKAELASVSNSMLILETLSWSFQKNRFLIIPKECILKDANVDVNNDDSNSSKSSRS